MSAYAFDCETDGLLDVLTKIHSLVLKDLETATIYSCCAHYNTMPDRPGVVRAPIEKGLALLADADLIVGHNVIKFDIPALRKVYPKWRTRAVVRDTLTLSRLLRGDIGDDDWKLVKRGTLPGNQRGKHSLESWGYRLGKWKGDYALVKEAEAKALGIRDKAAILAFVWGTWNPEMQTYCEQDVEVTAELYAYFLRKIAQWFISEECIDIEHEVSWIIARQERYGCGFDEAHAAVLYANLVAHRQRLETELQKTFKPIEVKTVFIPKANNKPRGYVKGVPFEKVKVVPFNPGSRQQIADRLRALGWEPTEFGKDGIPTVDDETLEALPWPEAKQLAEYQMVSKRLGLLSNGKQALMRHAKKGRIYGELSPGGAVTRRMTHKIVANIPGLVDKKTGKPQPYGKEFRQLFTCKPGNTFVGCDADSLEGRVMGHYVAHYDGGEFTRTLLEGNKALGTDLHSRNAKAMAAWKCHRETAKTFFYAMIYGARDPKLGEILGAPRAKRGAVGKAARAAVMKEFPALSMLIEAVQGKAKATGFIKGLDGCRLRVRSIDAALNTLFQSAGAIIMKKAQVILDTELCGVKPSVIGTQGPEAATRLVPGTDYEFSITYHDEWQIDTSPQHTDTVATAAPESIRLAGEHFKFRCPLKGNADLGSNWAETH